MKRVGMTVLLTMIFSIVFARIAQADYLDGVITSYESGNEGTDMFVRTSDGRKHDLWFDNMKKPFFQGKQLPWCPEFPCAGWPSQLVLNKTHVRVLVVKETVDGKAIESPTKIELLH
jgi:hypothetical protein